MEMLLIVVLVGIAIAGLAAVVAIWVERDRARPKKFAWALSVLILLATGVTILQSVLQDKQDKIDKAADEAEKEKLRGDMARMMQTLDRIAAESGDPRLQQFLSTELEAQSRANPEVVQKLAQRYADEGEDPAAKLAKHLPKSEVQKMARSGSIKTEPTTVKIEKKEEAAPAGRLLLAPKPVEEKPAADGETAEPSAAGGLKLPLGGTDDGAAGEGGKGGLAGLPLGGKKAGADEKKAGADDGKPAEGAKPGLLKPKAGPR